MIIARKISRNGTGQEEQRRRRALYCEKSHSLEVRDGSVGVVVVVGRGFVEEHSVRGRRTVVVGSEPYRPFRL